MYLTQTFGLTHEDAMADNGRAFISAIECGHFETIKYMVSTFKLTREDVIIQAFRCASHGSKNSKILG